MPSFPTPITTLTAILNKRSITKEQAEVLSVGPMGLDDAIGKLGYRPKGGIAYLEALPYFDADGHPLGDPQFYRFRVNYIPGWEPPEGKWDEYPKYRSPYRKGEFAYLPRGIGVDWTAVYGEPKIPMIVTEGEYKAIRACTAWGKEIPTLGLGGVWMFCARSASWPAGMDLNLVGREVYVAFDADKESTNEHPLKGGISGVDGAAKRLANKLANQGASPWVVYIARTETFRKARAGNIEAKMGLDDYIDAGGTWEELRATRENPVQYAGMAYLMDKYAFYRGESPGVVNVYTGELYKTVAWVREVEANCIEDAVVEDGGKMKRVKLRFAPMFIEHLERPEFSRWIFEPSLAFGLNQEAGTFNRWRGMAVEGMVGPGEGERYKEVVGVWRRFIKGLCGSGGWEYFERWAADIYQNPGRKTTIAMLLRTSLNGVGKSLLGEVLRDMIGEKHSARMGLSDVTHHFNSLLADRILIQVDEANDVKKEHDSALKNLVTAQECAVTLKGRDTVIVKNYARLFVTSNHVSPIVLDEHNRRFFVMEPDLTEEDERGEWATWVGELVAKVLRSGEGLRMLKWHLETLDLGGWEPTAHVPKTAAMMDIVETSSSKSGEFLNHLWDEFRRDDEGVWVVSPRMMANPDAKLLWGRFKDKVKTTRGQTVTHVMKLAGENGIKRVRVFVRSDKQRLAEKDVPGQGMSLDAGGGAITGKYLTDACSRAERAVALWQGVMPSSKY